MSEAARLPPTIVAEQLFALYQTSLEHYQTVDLETLHPERNTPAENDTRAEKDALSILRDELTGVGFPIDVLTNVEAAAFREAYPHRRTRPSLPDHLAKVIFGKVNPLHYDDE